MADTLSQLVDGVRIIAITEDALPPWPQSTDRREQWWVNCHYHESMSTSAAPQLFHEAKEDALAILRCLAERPSSRQYSCIVVTIYSHIPVVGAARPARRRAYRVTIPACNLPSQASLLTHDLFAQLRTYENSELDEVADLLQQTHHENLA
jgi:hypothetical protein